MLQNFKPTNGFTLVEVLVIAPAVILIIAGFIALIITITGDVLNTKNSSDLIYTTEDALARIEQDVLRTTEFRQTSYTPTSPQGQGDNTTAFDTVSQASTYLILRSQATDKNPIVDSRALIFAASGATCSTNPYTFDTVYFTKVVNGVTSLWRRIVFGSTTDAGTPCSGTTPWQQPTCSPTYTNTFCKADDTLLLSNVSTITLRYLNAAGTQINTTTPTAGTAVSNPNDAAGTTNASSISLSLSVGNTVAGRAGTYTGSLSAKKAPETAAAAAPAAPVAINYSDDFTSSGALGNVKTGTPTLAWQFLNSTTTDWTRNSGGYASTTTAATSNPIAAADTGVANVMITEGVRSTGNAIYFRVVDGSNWLRLRVNETSTTTSYQASEEEWYFDCRNISGGTAYYTWLAAGSGVGSSCQQYYKTGATRTTTQYSTTYAYFLILDKAVNGTVTQLASNSIGSSAPAYIKVTAKGGSIQTSYGSTTATTSTGSTVTDVTNQTATKHGIGYASSTYSSSTGVKSISIVDAP